MFFQSRESLQENADSAYSPEQTKSLLTKLVLLLILLAGNNAFSCLGEDVLDDVI